ncbi:MAG: DUF2752 domain-containing protein [Pirellulales bacterium]
MSRSFPARFDSVTQTDQVGSVRFTRRRRLFAAALGAGWMVPLVVALWLEPSPTGLGTHRQLGLPPCTSIWLFGIRCPSCGMTTSWSHAVRGDWSSAVGANTAGALLAALTMLGGPWLMLSAARGRWLLIRPTERLLAVGAVIVAVVTLLDWIRRL